MAQDPEQVKRKVAILGTGDVGKALATGFARLGDTVLVGSRAAVEKGSKTDDKTSKSKAALIAEFGLVTFEDACKKSDIIVLAVNFDPIRNILDTIKPHCESKLVIDTCNPIKYVGGKMPIILHKDVLKEHASCGELVAAILDKSHVVKCWNIVGYAWMTDGNPGGKTFEYDPLMMICGNDEESKKTVNGILNEFNWKDILDVGGIEMSCHLESMCFLWCARGFIKGCWTHNWAHMMPSDHDPTKKSN